MTIPVLLRLAILLLILGAGAGGLLEAQGPQPSADSAELREARRVLHLAREAASQVPAGDRSSTLIYNLCGTFGRAGDFAAAFETTELLKEEDRTRPFWGIAWAYAYRGDLAAARHTALAMTVPDEQAGALSQIASLQAQAGDIAGALATVEMIGLKNHRLDVLLTIADTLRQRGDLDQAGSLLQRVLGAVDAGEEAAEASQQIERVLHWHRVGRALLDIGDRAGWATMVQRIENFASSSPDPDARRKAVGHLVRLLAAGGDFQQALEEAAGLWPGRERDFALAEIVQEQARAGNLVAARETAATISLPANQANAIRSIVDVQARAGDTLGAIETAASLPPVAQAQVLMGAAWSVSWYGPNPASLRLYEAALDAARGAEELGDVYFMALAVFQARAGDIPGALKTVRGMSKEVRRNEGLYRLAYDQTIAGDPRGALRWVTMETSPAARAEALLGVAHGLLHLHHK